MKILKPIAALLLALPTPALSQRMFIPIPMPGKETHCGNGTPAEIERAIYEAQASLPKFWKYFKSTWIHGDRFHVYVAIPKNKQEYYYVWAHVTSVTGNYASAKIEIPDKRNPALSKGKDVSLRLDDPLDWGYRSMWDEKWFGLFTERTELLHCSADDKAYLLQAVYRSPPVPIDW